MNPALNITGLNLVLPFGIVCDANPAAKSYEFVLQKSDGTELGRPNLNNPPALDLSTLGSLPGDYSVTVTASDDKEDGTTAKATFTVEATGIVNFKEVTVPAAPVATPATPVAPTATAATPVTAAAGTGATPVVASATAPVIPVTAATATAAAPVATATAPVAPVAPAGNAPAGTTPPAANAAAAGAVPPVIPAAGTTAPVATTTAATTAAAAGAAAALAATNPAGTAAPAAQPAQPVTPQPTPWQRNRQRILSVLVLLACIAASIWVTWYVTTEHNKTGGAPLASDGQQALIVDTNAVATLAKQMLQELVRQQAATSVMNNSNAGLGSVNGTGNVVKVGDLKESDGVMIGNNFYMWSNSSPASAVQTVKDLARAVTASGSMWPKGCTNVVTVTVPLDKLGQPVFRASDTRIVPGTVVLVIPPNNSWDAFCGVDPFPNATALWMDTDGKVHPLSITPGTVRDPSRDTKNLLQYLVFLNEGASSAMLSAVFTKL